jgi:hypothetical protein
MLAQNAIEGPSRQKWDQTKSSLSQAIHLLHVRLSCELARFCLMVTNLRPITDTDSIWTWRLPQSTSIDHAKADRQYIAKRIPVNCQRAVG